MGDLIDYAGLEPRVEEFAARFRDASPFPWLVVDDFLSPGLVGELADGFDAALLRANKDPNAPKKHSHVLRKIGLRRREMMEDIHCRMFDELASPRFLAFLSRITGIDPLYADPDLDGGGLHQIHRGGYLNIHTDFNGHPKTGKHRRLNILLYLNPEWRDEWGGALEFWPEDNSAMAASVMPRGGRMALFETSEISFHGHPAPLNCPDDKVRRSLAAYYYSDWPADLALREKTNYRLTPAQQAVLETRIRGLLSSGILPADIVTQLMTDYQHRDIKVVLAKVRAA